MLVFGIGMLLYIGGPVTLIGVGVMFCLLFVTAMLGLRSKNAQAAYQACADETINVIREAVDGVKVIQMPVCEEANPSTNPSPNPTQVVKMQVWEEAYIEAIRRKRSRETNQLRRVRVLITIIMTTGRISPLLGFATTVVILWAIQGSLSASVVFPMLQLFMALRIPFIMLPLCIQFVVQVTTNPELTLTQL